MPRPPVGSIWHATCDAAPAPQIKLGTIEQSEVENEYVLRPYMNSAKKRKAL